MLREGSPPPTCHVSHVTCHVLCVMCHMSHFFVDKVVKLVGGGYVINGATMSSLFFLYSPTQPSRGA